MRSKSRVWQSFRTFFWVGILLLLIVQSVSAQTPKNDFGFKKKLYPIATGSDLLQQDDLFMMEVQFKPMRMISVEVTDPKTGKKTTELVWYLIYKAVNRQVGVRADRTGLDPQNNLDAKAKPLFIPDFTLITNDNGKPQIFHDAIVPEAQKIIKLREERHSTGWKLQNAVEVVKDVPLAIAEKSESESNAIYGVVMWRNIPAATDYFTVFMSGFSSAYRTGPGPDNEKIISRHTIQLDFWRPGDRFDQNEAEFRRPTDRFDEVGNVLRKSDNSNPKMDLPPGRILKLPRLLLRRKNNETEEVRGRRQFAEALLPTERHERAGKIRTKMTRRQR